MTPPNLADSGNSSDSGMHFAQDFPLQSNDPRHSPLQPYDDFEEDELATDAIWNWYTKKGGALMCALRGSDVTAGIVIKDKRTPTSAASAWDGDFFSELYTWYWRSVTPSAYNYHIDDTWKISSVLQDFGVSAQPKWQGGDNRVWRIEHWDPEKTEDDRQVPAINQWYNVGGINYQSTKAHYEFGINAKGGVIFAFSFESPKNSARDEWYGGTEKVNPALLPQLRSFSDILWGFWESNSPNIKNIRYFIALGASNYLTEQLIMNCLQKVEKELEEWPGVTFSTDSDEGRALLGSPNGATFAYFLMQHKSQLGDQIIDQVTVFKPEGDDDPKVVAPALVFRVSRVSAAPHKDQL